MTARPATEQASAGRNFRVYYALIALIVGLALGALIGPSDSGARANALEVAQFIGTLWLNALKMTVIPLVVTLLVVGIAKGREAARGGIIAGRSVLWMVAICTSSAIFGALMITLLTRVFPLPRATAADLQVALAGIEQSKEPLAGIADFFKGVIPDNVFAAATNGDTSSRSPVPTLTSLISLNSAAFASCKPSITSIAGTAAPAMTVTERAITGGSVSPVLLTTKPAIAA